MSGDFAFGLLGILLAFIGIVIPVLIGFEDIRKRPSILLSVIAMVISGGMLVTLAALAVFGSALARDIQPSAETRQDETGIQLTQTAIVITQTAMFYQPAEAYTPEVLATQQSSQLSQTPLSVITSTGLQPSTPIPVTATSTETPGPLRGHQLASIGTGVFAQVTYSDGLAPYDQDWLSTYHFRIQRIRPEENPDGCGVSIYDTDNIWFGASAYTEFTVNGDEIGELVVGTGRHGYVLEWPVHVGDVLCAVGYDHSGYHIIIGPDMYYHYDSYCYRGYC